LVQKNAIRQPTKKSF